MNLNPAAEKCPFQNETARVSARKQTNNRPRWHLLCYQIFPLSFNAPVI